MAERRRRETAGRAHRRRAVVLGTAGAVVVAGAGTAWAMSGSDGPSYRLASVQRSDIAQTVDADGTLAARDSSTLAFAASGTVDSVQVAVGDKVRAGDTLATLDKADLRAAVTAARATLAQARQRLADDEEAQVSGTAPAASSAATSSAPASGARSADSATSVRLVSSTMPTNSPPGGSDTNAAVAAVRAAQQAVEAAQRALDDAIARVSGDVDAADAACTSDDVDPATETGTANSDGTVSGTVDATPVIATLLDTTTTSTNPQSIAAGGTYSFAGLTAGESYQVVLVPRLDTAACSAAIETIKTDQSGATNPASVVSAKAALADAIAKLDTAVAALSAAGGSDGQSATPSGAAPSGTTGARPSSAPTGAAPSGSASATVPADGSSTTTVTAEQIAADAKAIDAAKAELAVAKHDVGYATLTTPISGTVGAVTMTKGDSVAASSTSSTITVVGSGTLSVDVDIALADIDLVQVGQQAQVTVDGRSKPLAATVSYVGATNSSDSTGSSSTYPVTVGLRSRDARLFDGMGATVAISVGEADGVLSVPISAIHAVGTLHTVTVYEHGKAVTKQVTLGVEGEDRVQIKSGLSAGDQVVLAEISAAVPSANDSSRFGNRSSLSGLGGLTGGGGGRVVFNRPPGGN